MEKESFSTARLANMPLHAITEVLHEPGLLDRLDYELRNFEFTEQEKIARAVGLAQELHKEDSREREPYINHIYRVATRMITYYGVNDGDVIAAGILHDSIEDHASALAGVRPGPKRAAAAAAISETFNPRVSGLVMAVTNPEPIQGINKNEQYLEHVAQLSEAEDPWPLIIKLSDFTDNATGSTYLNSEKKLLKLAVKYRPVISVLRKALTRTDLPISAGVVSHINEQLNKTEQWLNSLPLPLAS